MRRSKSNSQIPIGRRGSTGRSGSLDRLAVPSFKKSIGSAAKTSAGVSTFGSARPISTVKKSFLPTAVASGSKQTPTGILAAKKLSFSATPSSARSRSKSPRGTERSANNPVWISQIYSNVRSFLENHPDCPDHVLHNLKPISLQTFITVVNLLLKEIAPRIQINTTNYKEFLTNTLKVLGYSGQLSNSMFKTVSAMHTWPHIISILAWLVDLVTVLGTLNQPVECDVKTQKFDCVTTFLNKRYHAYNSGQPVSESDSMFMTEFARILDIDEERDKMLATELESIIKKKEDLVMRDSALDSKNEAVKQDIETMTNKIELFNLRKNEKNEKDEDMDCRTELLTKRQAKLALECEEQGKHIAAFKETIKKQRYSFSEKKRVLYQIDSMRHTLQLKKEKIRVQKKVKEDSEAKLSEASKKVETKYYLVNNELMHMAVLAPELTNLVIKSTDFLSKEFEKEIQGFARKIEEYSERYKMEIAVKKSDIIKDNSTIVVVRQQIEDAKTNAARLTRREKELKEKIQICDGEITNLQERREMEKKDFLFRMKELKEVDAELLETQNKYQAICALKEEKHQNLRSVIERHRKFFYELHDILMEQTEEKIKIRNNVYNGLMNCMSKIQENQEKVIKDLKNLDKIAKDKHSR